MTRPDEPFLARWSRRKAAARHAEPTESPPAEPIPAEALPAEGEPAAVEPATPEAPSSCPALPDIDTLDAASDFRPFMQAGVPEELRRQALRKLWRVNPIINSLDGLDDHSVTHDFSDAATAMPDLKTAYRVGKGMTRALEELTDAAPDQAAPALTADADTASEPTALPPASPLAGDRSRS